MNTMTAASPAIAPPRMLRTLGGISMAVGPGLALLNLWLGMAAINQLAQAGVTGGPAVALGVEIAVFAIVGLLLAAGGIGLLAQKRWGRWVSLAGAVGTFVGLLTAACVVQIVAAWPVDHPMPSYRITAGAPALSPLWGIALLVLLNLPEVRAWARAGSVKAGAADATAATATTAAPVKTETLAIASLVLSLIPFALLTQIAALIVGIIALRRIARARGGLAGKGFAVAGVAVSSAILLFIIGILLLVFVLAKK